MKILARGETTPGTITVLLYHKIEEPGSNNVRDLFVSPRIFDRQLAFLRNIGVDFISEDQLVDFYYNDKPLSRNSVLITFDDGFLDNYKSAFPILKKHTAPALVFLVADFIGKSFVQKGDTNNFLSIEQIHEMAESGIAFGSHTLTHPSLPKLSAVDMRKEICDSRKALEDIVKKQIRTICYPYGSYNETALELAKETPYSCAFTLHRGTNRRSTDPFRLRRIKPRDNMASFVTMFYSAPHIERLRSLMSLWEKK